MRFGSALRLTKIVQQSREAEAFPIPEGERTILKVQGQLLSFGHQFVTFVFKFDKSHDVLLSKYGFGAGQQCATRPKLHMPQQQTHAIERSPLCDVPVAANFCRVMRGLLACQFGINSVPLPGQSCCY
jgi:hypothetical protein